MKKKSFLSIAYPLLMTVLTYLPILVVVVYSFNESRLTSTFEGFSLKWYALLFKDKNMLNALLNSLLLASLSSLLAAIIATSAALSFKKARIFGKALIEKASLLPLIIPEIILGMVFMAFFSLMGFKFGFVTLLIAHTAFCIPYVYTQVSARIETLDFLCIDAARDLGASGLRTFFTVTLPLIFPSILSGIFLSFAMSFDDVIISVFCTGSSVNTLPVMVYTQLKTGVTPQINALCTLMLAVTLLFYTISAIIKNKGDKK